MSGPRPKYAVEVTTQEEQSLRRLVNAPKAPQGKARRARILLAAHDHPEWSNQQIDRETGTADRVMRKFLERQPEIDYASSTTPVQTFPRGLDTEVMRFDILERAWREDDNRSWREHVTPYIYHHPEVSSLHCVTNAVDYSQMRWTVDAPEDLALATRICQHFGHDRFSWREVLILCQEHPEWLDLNRHVHQKVV